MIHTQGIALIRHKRLFSDTLPNNCSIQVKYQQKSFITIIWEKSMDCMSIQMVPREETELHRKHSHSIIVSLEVWLAWDGRWMISWPEYIHIIHKQTTQNRISIKSNKEKEIKQPFLFFFRDLDLDPDFFYSRGSWTDLVNLSPNWFSRFLKYCNYSKVK